MAQDAIETPLLKLYEAKAYSQVVREADSLLETGDGNQARLQHIKADALYFLNDVEGSLQAYLAALALVDAHPVDTVHLIEIYSHAGFCYSYLGRYAEAIPYYEQALQVATACGDKKEKANQLFHLGSLYGGMGQYSKAQEYFRLCYEIDFALKDTVALAYDLSKLGELNENLKDYSKAVKYYREALKVKETKSENHNTHVLRIGKLANAFLHLGELDSAKFYNQQSIDEALKIKDTLSYFKQLIVSANIMVSEKKFEKAAETGRRCHSYFRESAEGKYSVSASLVSSQALIGLDQPREADRLLQEVIEVSKRQGFLEELVVAYERRSRLQEDMGNFRLSLAITKDYQRLKDSLTQRDNQQSILLLDQEYQSSQRLQQIELLTTQNKLTALSLQKKRREQYALLFVLLFIVVIGGFISYILITMARLNERLQAEEVDNLKLKINSLVEGSSVGLNIDAKQLNKRLIAPLSERELEILMLAVSDKNNREIASQVHVSVNTVKYHLKNIYEKLGVSNRKEALQFAIEGSK